MQHMHSTRRSSLPQAGLRRSTGFALKRATVKHTRAALPCAAARPPRVPIYAAGASLQPASSLPATAARWRSRAVVGKVAACKRRLAIPRFRVLKSTFTKRTDHEHEQEHTHKHEHIHKHDCHRHALMHAHTNASHSRRFSSLRTPLSAETYTHSMAWHGITHSPTHSHRTKRRRSDERPRQKQTWSERERYDEREDREIATGVRRRAETGQRHAQGA